MKRLRPRSTVLGGAVIGLIVGAAAYGAISSSSAVTITPVAYNPASVSVSGSPAAAPAAPCAAGETLEKGACIVHARVVHVEKVVAAPAPAVRSAQAQEDRSGRGRTERVGDSNEDGDDHGGNRDDHKGED